MRSATITLIAAFLFLILAIVLQILTVQSMLLRLSNPISQSVRGVFPRYKVPFLPAFFASSTLNQPAPHAQLHPLASQHHFTTSSAKMVDSKTFFDAVESRRSMYQLTNESTIADARIKELVTHTIKHVPSSFNSQTTRLVVVLKEKHEELWDAIMEIYQLQLPADKFEHAKGRMVGFRKAYGTVSWTMLSPSLCSCHEVEAEAEAEADIIGRRSSSTKTHPT